MLTATGVVDGKRGDFSTTYRINTAQSIEKNVSQVIESATQTAMDNLVQIRPWELLIKNTEISEIHKELEMHGRA